MSIAQRHVLGCPTSVRLHNVERGLIEEGIERPVVAQVMGREMLDAKFAAQDSDAFIDGPGRKGLIRVISGKEWASYPLHL